MAEQQLTLDQCWSQITQTEYPGPLPTTDPGALTSSKLMFSPYNWCVALLRCKKRWQPLLKAKDGCPGVCEPDVLAFRTLLLHHQRHTKWLSKSAHCLHMHTSLKFASIIIITVPCLHPDMAPQMQRHAGLH